MLSPPSVFQKRSRQAQRMRRVQISKPEDDTSLALRHAGPACSFCSGGAHSSVF